MAHAEHDGIFECGVTMLARNSVNVHSVDARRS